jgi:hypothetical protein
MKKHKKLNLKKQTVANLEMSRLFGGRDEPTTGAETELDSDYCQSEYYYACVTDNDLTCHLCPAETNPGPV